MCVCMHVYVYTMFICISYLGYYMDVYSLSFMCACMCIYIWYLYMCAYISFRLYKGNMQKSSRIVYKQKNKF